MSGPPARTEHGERESPLVLLAVLGQLLIYLVSVCFARLLDLEAFDAYAVASALFLLMAMIAPLGSEKYALRALPVYIERLDWARARGYLRFAWRRVWRMSVLLGVALLAWALWPGSRLADANRSSVAVAALAIPVGAAVHFGLEALTAAGRKIAALAIFRLVVPGSALACIGLALVLQLPLSAPLAIACWGPGWLLALVLMLRAGRASLAPVLQQPEVFDDRQRWRAESRPFFIYRMAVALLGQSGLIAMAALQAPKVAIGAYAAAVGTAGLAGVLAAATNRSYARRLSILLERRDHAGVLQLRRERLRWLLPTLLVFVAACFAFGDELLALFRPEFAEQGRSALRILALGTAVSVLLSLAPTYLKFQRRQRLAYATVVGAALVQGLLLLWLVPRLGATGAALASATSIGGMYVASAWLAWRELLRVTASPLQE